MRRCTPVWFAMLLASTSCSDDGDQPATEPDASVPGWYGAACTTNDACDSKLCVDGACSKLCKRMNDCPTVAGKPFDCGEVAAIGKVACYPRRYKTGPLTTGADCSLDSKCAAGFACLGLVGTTDRYCSEKCKTDQDCPPRYRCATTQTGKDPVDATHWCRRREFCHPCVIDDQCGDPDDLCLTDLNGNRYCSKACTATGNTCPAYAKCEDAGNQKLQCKHKAGFCFRSMKAEGDLCSPCIAHGMASTSDADYVIAEANVCKAGGYCYVPSRYTMEAYCLTPCNGTCPTAPGLTYSCQSLKSLGGKFCVPIAKDPDTGEYTFGSCVP